jgi:hypothetical protein
MPIAFLFLVTYIITNYELQITNYELQITNILSILFTDIYKNKYL